MLPTSPDKHLRILTSYQQRKFQHLWTLFPLMVEILPEGMSGDVEVRHGILSPSQAFELSRSQGELWTPGRFCQLLICGHVWMHDILDERIKNQRVVREAHGDVLITGLGLGMILHPILKKPDVDFGEQWNRNVR